MWFKAKKKHSTFVLKTKVSQAEMDFLVTVNESLVSVINSAGTKLSNKGKLALSEILYRHADRVCSPSDRDDGL
jgi:hypothetical protein